MLGFCFKEGLFIMARRAMARDRARGSKCGQMGLILMGSGRMTWPVGRAISTNSTASTTKATSYATDSTATAST